MTSTQQKWAMRKIS